MAHITVFSVSEFGSLGRCAALGGIMKQQQSR
jgi:hypothetical protein